MEVKKSYYAVIPADVRYDKEICPNAKLLYGEITALCNQEGFCWANNQYFMALYEVGKNTIIRWINELVDKGYLIKNIQYSEDGKTVLQRCLSLPNDTRGYQNCNEGGAKNDTTPSIKNDTHNTTSTITTTNITVSKKVSKERDTGAREYQRESYTELLTRLGYSKPLQKQIFKFIQFQQANKKVVTNAMLEQTMRCIESAAERRVRGSLPGNFSEQLKTDISIYREDIENYIHSAIQQALNGQWFEIKEPKEFKTAAEWESQAEEDMKLWGL